MQTNSKWWQTAVFYQIYPRSFYDSDGDGVGDLKGIMAQLPYIKELGVDAIWINPFFQSPMLDFGYDISCYYEVDPTFGTNQDMFELIHQAHKLDLKVIFDLVLNHTSDQHAWFLESKSCLNNSKRDWYIWHQTQPNNWKSLLGKPAWTKSPESKEYYYHAFLACQPDLNLRNPEVIEEIIKIVGLYLDLGVDGFRLDAVNTFFEDQNLRDNPHFQEDPNHFRSYQHTFDQDENFELIQKIKTKLNQYSDRVLIGEVNPSGPEASNWLKYHDPELCGLDLVTNFDLLYGQLTFDKIFTAIEKQQSLLAWAWPSYALSSHDQIRFGSRLAQAGDNQTNVAKIDQIKFISTFLLTIKGTPFIYYGDELGLLEYTDFAPDQIRDTFALVNPSNPSRDGCRTPMLWSDEPQAGFSKNPKTWLPIHHNFQVSNVATQLRDVNSVLNHYKKILKLRKKYPALQLGKLNLKSNQPEILEFERVLNQESIFIVLNFGEADFLVDPKYHQYQIIDSNLLVNNILKPLGYIIYGI